jgi:phage terminase large subunit
MAAAAHELLPPKMRDLFFAPGANGVAEYIPSDYKIAHGGRGSAKSWGFGSTACVLGSLGPLRVMCVRETQVSIADSIHKLLAVQIDRLGLGAYYDIQQKVIVGKHVPSEFIFAGIKTDPGKIKSAEGIDVCLVEEAEKISEQSWSYLIPTIRDAGAEIWVAFNPRNREDPTSQRFLVRQPPNSRIVQMNWSDNPWFPERLARERQYSLQLIREAKDDNERVAAQADYDHIWEGAYQRATEAAVFRRRVVVDAFEPNENTRFYFGADWGFANDPTVLVCFWIEGEELFIYKEAYGYRVEIDETPALFDTIEGSRRWPIRADCARPETISYMARQGFNISAAEKWPGSVEDGIAHVKAFKLIHIHEAHCPKMQEEARLYSYKEDRVTGDVLPLLKPGYDHGWDSVRYGLDGVIQRRGIAGLWARLAER